MNKSIKELVVEKFYNNEKNIKIIGSYEKEGMRVKANVTIFYRKKDGEKSAAYSKWQGADLDNSPSKFVLTECFLNQGEDYNGTEQFILLKFDGVTDMDTYVAEMNFKRNTPNENIS